METKNVYIGYQDNEVISDLNLQFEAGKIHSILGPNGCGKSTLLKALGKQIQSTAGEVSFKNSDINTWSRKAFARELAFLMQVHESNPEVTVRQLIEYGRFPHKRKFERLNQEDQAIVDQAISLTHLVDLAERTVDRLSGGERQRAWIAMALAQQPAVLLLDEPTSYLDIHHQLEIIELIKRLNVEQGITIILVLHDINQAAMISDQLIVLQSGSLYDFGTPRKVITHSMLRDVFKVDAEIDSSFEDESISVYNFQLLEE
ncbi:iron complex transport system ATP-binding protein [Paenibacillus sp. JGP012]|uniref:ABC transporter ATP-binding protein n=1 Tax=Paenibacillus sp. JGP012 TaxID=2735914 RepID=UPI00160B237F|nr:ABC transporter ATP-binding protein [Paenibacillus sp. JGP012]MBB6021882.1 iron complex transport system ATP-binding protein [Paenibacillus sp. JGP012]